MAESVIDLFSESIKSAVNARLLGVAPQNFGRISVSLEPNVEYKATESADLLLSIDYHFF